MAEIAGIRSKILLFGGDTPAGTRVYQLMRLCPDNHNERSGLMLGTPFVESWGASLS